jgi:hypothetical protein
MRSLPRRSVVQSSFAAGPLFLIGAAVAIVLAAGAGGYGYHRDELYFLVCARHLAWGYADQGPLSPFIAYLMHAIAPDSLTVLRLPSALMSGASVAVAGAIAFELGATRRAQVIAAGCAAVGAFSLYTGHRGSYEREMGGSGQSRAWLPGSRF